MPKKNNKPWGKRLVHKIETLRSEIGKMISANKIQIIGKNKIRNPKDTR